MPCSDADAVGGPCRRRSRPSSPGQPASAKSPGQSCRSCGWRLPTPGSPMPGESLLQTVLRQVGDATGDLADPGPGVNVAALRGADERVHRRTQRPAKVDRVRRDCSLYPEMLPSSLREPGSMLHCSADRRRLRLAGQHADPGAGASHPFRVRRLAATGHHRVRRRIPAPAPATTPARKSPRSPRATRRSVARERAGSAT